jgi:DNA-binding NtrC family response regulator
MDSGPPCVLVVDDEPHIVRIMAFSLQRLGYDVHAFSQAQAALDAIAAARYDLAFVDLMMAPIDGLAVLAELRRRSPGTLVILMSAYGSPALARDAKALGAYDYLPKPFGFQDLHWIVSRALEHRRLTGEARV